MCGMYNPQLPKTKFYKKLKTEPVGTRCINCGYTYTEGTVKQRNKKLRKHLRECGRNPPCIVTTPEDDYLEFTKYHYQRNCPFTMYIDSESCLVSDQALKEKVEKKLIDRGRGQMETDSDSDMETDEHLELASFTPAPPSKENFDVTLDNTPLQDEMSDNHLISGVSISVVTLPHLQHYFPVPYTVSGIDAGMYIYIYI